MAKNLSNPLKVALRTRMKGDVIKKISPESRARQSKAITEKVLYHIITYQRIKSSIKFI